MAKRFTDTEKWKKPFFTKLSYKAKLAWIYLTDNCDHTGVWPINLDLMSFQVGCKITLDNLLHWFGDKIYLFEDDKILIKPFIDFQYSQLNPENNAHKAIIKLLDKLGPIEGLKSPSRGALVKVKDKVTVTDKVTVKETEEVTEEEGPELSEVGAQKTKGSVAFHAYAEAYEKAYRVPPSRNKKMNSMFKELAERLGEDAPDVASFYVTHKDYVYVKSGHAVGLLVRDAEKLRTEWATGERITSMKAKSIETRDHYAEQMEMVRRGEI